MMFLTRLWVRAWKKWGCKTVIARFSVTRQELLAVGAEKAILLDGLDTIAVDQTERPVNIDGDVFSPLTSDMVRDNFPFWGTRHTMNMVKELADGGYLEIDDIASGYKLFRITSKWRNLVLGKEE